MTYNAKFLPNLAHTLHPLGCINLYARILNRPGKPNKKAFVAAKKLCQDCVLTHYDARKP